MIIRGNDKQILHVSALFQGSTHDYNLLKTIFDPIQDWFKDKEVVLDLGFQGFQKDYLCESVKMPIKRKRVAKGISNELNQEQKQYNHKVASERMPIEHSIGQMKTFGCIQGRTRTRNKQLLNTLVGLTAGIVNFKNSFSY